MIKWLLKNSVWTVSITFMVISTIYWTFLATDRYVSTANVVLESPQISSDATLSFQSILSGSTSNSNDMLLLRDYLLSTDMLKKLDSQYDFRGHYSNENIDFISRLKNKDAPMELLHEYYQSVLKIELDEYAQVLRINAIAYDPEYAKELLTYLLGEGEKKMNDMGKRLAEEQVKFLEEQVGQLSINLDNNRKVLLDYQNINGLISPTGTVENINSVVASLEAQLANFKAQRIAMQSYQSKKSSDLIKMDSEIKALMKQIGIEKSKMAQKNGNALNTLSSEYQTLEMKMIFSKESYSTALAALENTRIEAARKLKQLSILQTPTLPEYASEPKRIYNITVTILMTLFLGLILHMLLMIIRDHQD